MSFMSALKVPCSKRRTEATPGKHSSPIANTSSFSESGHGLVIPASCIPRAGIKTSDPQPLVLHVSEDGGLAWSDVYFDDVTYGGVWEMALHREGNRDRIFLGLDQGGVYEIEVR